MRLPWNADAEQTCLELRFHFLDINVHREMELAAERSDLSFPNNKIRRIFIGVCGGVLGFLWSLLESLVIQTDGAVRLSALTYSLRLDSFGLRLPRTERRARDYQRLEARPVDADGLGVFDARDFELDQVVGDCVADVDVRVVRVRLLVGSPAGQHAEEGVVLVEALVLVVDELEWRLVEGVGVGCEGGHGGEWVVVTLMVRRVLVGVCWAVVLDWECDGVME